MLKLVGRKLTDLIDEWICSYGKSGTILLLKDQ